MCPFDTPRERERAIRCVPLARLWHVDVSTNTVKSYLASSFRKLGISKRSELEKFMLR